VVVILEFEVLREVYIALPGRVDVNKPLVEGQGGVFGMMVVGIEAFERR
jgi:hypothetical protein